MHQFPIFIGLSHIGQIYSIGWAKKIGKCGVYDFNKIQLKKFKSGKYTDQEKNLKKIKFNKNNLIIFEDIRQLKDKKIFFFTYDTPINSAGIPNLKPIENFLKKLFQINFKYQVKIIISSQVPPGYLDYIKNKYLNNNHKIKLIYMVDTLKMGNSIERFIKPDQLIFGLSDNNKKTILELFKNFKCKIFFFSIAESELIKVAINLYLYFSVNFANILENFSSELGLSFSKIINTLKTDPRIGQHAYINPSSGISGGHLERDAYYIRKLVKNTITRKIFDNLKKFNDDLKAKLKSIIYLSTKKKIKNILIVGFSYKKNSFSLIGSIFKSILNDKNLKINVYDSFYPNINFNINQIYNLKEGISNANIVIYNYGKINDLKIIKNQFSKKNKKILINISSENKEFLKNKKNIINFFSKETIEFK